ncbi:hypothetical protein BDF21DRAFT_407319 [Thamnidium elegans]|uniref:Glutathione S-transferase n=1 Tax=Thamnidium elegans TaxID=101142 RepID=A0A8H7SVC2_9FUNG|nr:hypothetical protein INT48_001823 [Thamnidium elegans]KAI8096033.1 hypothetical protein BDF21DRAFT_407319 [Thamnidium elegans]
MSPHLTLYTFKLSLWAAAGRLAVYELDVPDVKQVEIDLSKAENFSPEYLAINPQHTIPALKIEENGETQVKTDTKSVVEYLDNLAGNRLSIPGEKEEIDSFLKEMHQDADIGNALFFTSGNPQELEQKKNMIVPFLQGRIKGWETYLEQAPQYKDLYNKNIEESKKIIHVYESGKADEMFATNKHLWEVGQKFLDKAESLLKANGSFLFGKYSVAEIHFTPYLYRALLVRKPEQVFANRPNLETYYKHIQARPSFEKTFQ